MNDYQKKVIKDAYRNASENAYAYLGEVVAGEFDEIRQYFPAIIGIGVELDVKMECMMVSLGVPNDLPDNVIGLYQLIVLCWNNKKTSQRAFDAAIELEN